MSPRISLKLKSTGFGANFRKMKQKRKDKIEDFLLLKLLLIFSEEKKPDELTKDTVENQELEEVNYTG